MSIDNVQDVKEYLSKTILYDCQESEVYIIVSANAYEMARGEQCFDVYSGKYVTFSDYEDYRNFVLDSRKHKDERYSEGKDEEVQT